MSVPAGLMMNQFQGMAPNGLLMGAPNSIQGGLLSTALQPPSSNPYPMGSWSRLAYQMAGSPQQGPYSSVPVPPSTGGGVGSAAAGGIGGLLGSVAQNPTLTKNLIQGASGLLSPAVGSPAWEAAITSGTSAGIPAASAIAAPTAAEVASSIGAPASGDLFAGAQGAADAAATPAPAQTAAAAPASGLSATGAAGLAGFAALTGAAVNGLLGGYENDPKLAAVDMMNSLQNVDPALYATLYQAYQSGGPDAIAKTMGGLFNPQMPAIPGLAGSGYRPQGHAAGLS